LLPRKKVIIVTSEFPPGPGGIGDHAYNLSEQLVENNFDVIVLSELREEFVNQWKSTPYKAQIEYFKRRKFIPNLDFLFAFIRLFLKYQDATWIASGAKSLITLGISSFLFNPKAIAILHGHELLKGPGFKRWLIRKTINKFSSAVAVSQFSKDNSKKILDEKKIVVIQNGFNPSKYIPSPTLPKLPNSDALNLLTVGRVSARKGQQNVVKALHSLLRKYPKVIYHMVGIDDSSGYLNTIIEELQFGNHVKTHGVLSDTELIKVFGKTDIFIMLSQNMPDGDVEGFGIAIIEANYFGLPAIGALGCGIEQAIKDGFNGRLVRIDDVDKIGEAIDDLMVNYSTYSNHAISWARDHSWSTIIKKYLDLITSLD